MYSLLGRSYLDAGRFSKTVTANILSTPPGKPFKRHSLWRVIAACRSVARSVREISLEAYTVEATHADYAIRIRINLIPLHPKAPIDRFCRLWQTLLN